MPHKPVKVIRPHRFHLTSSKQHQPIENLSGDGEAGKRIDFDSGKLAILKRKLAAVGDEPPVTIASPEDQAAAERWRALHEQNLGEIDNHGSIAGTIADDAVNTILPIARGAAGGLRQVAGRGAYNFLRNSAGSAANGYETIHRGKGSYDPSTAPDLTDATNHEAANALGDTVQSSLLATTGQLPTLEAASIGKDAWQAARHPKDAIADAKADVADIQQNPGDRLASAAATGEGYLGARAIGKALANNAERFNPAAPAVPLKAGVMSWLKGQVQAAGHRLATPYRALTAPAASAGTTLSDTASGLKSPAPLNNPVAPAVEGAAADAGSPVSEASPWLRHLRTAGRFAMQTPLNNPVAPAVEGAADAGAVAAKASPWLGRLATAGRFVGRLGAVDQVANAGGALYTGLRQAYGSLADQQQYAAAVENQRGQDQTRGAGGAAWDDAKAVGSAFLGDPQHASRILAANGENMGLFDGGAKAMDDEEFNVRSNAKVEQQGALAQYFPRILPAQVNQMADVAATNASNNYRLFKINGDKPYPLGPGSFERRLNDPQGPYAAMKPADREAWRDLGRRLGGTTAESLLNDPQFAQEFDPTAKVTPYATPHVSYAAPAAPGGQAPAPVQPSVPPAPAAPKPMGRGVAAPPMATHARMPAIKVPPPPPVSPGAAPIGQPFSPLRGAKTAAAAIPPSTPPAAPPPPIVPPAAPAVPPAKPVIPPAQPVVPPAKPSTPYVPKPHPFGDVVLANDTGLSAAVRQNQLASGMAKQTPPAPPVRMSADGKPMIAPNSSGDTPLTEDQWQARANAQLTGMMPDMLTDLRPGATRSLGQRAYASAAEVARQVGLGTVLPVPDMAGKPHPTTDPVPGTMTQDPTQPAAPVTNGLHDWNAPIQQAIQGGFSAFALPEGPQRQQAMTAVGKKLSDDFSAGIAADGALPPDQKAAQFAAREQSFGNPIARHILATHFNDPFMADPKLPYGGKDGFEDRMMRHGADADANVIQSQLAQTPSQTPEELLKNNWQLAMIPLGIMMAMTSEGSAGKILGLLMATMGGANAYGRFAKLKSPEFAKYVQAKAAGTTTPQQDQENAATYQDLVLAQQHGLVNIQQKTEEAAASLARNAQPAPAAPATTPAPATP